MCSIVNKCVLPWLISSMILFFHLGLLADDYFYNGMGTTIIPSSDVDVTAGDHPIEIKKKAPLTVHRFTGDACDDPWAVWDALI